MAGPGPEITKTFYPDTSRSGYITRTDTFTTVYSATVGDGTIGIDTSPPAALLKRWSMMIAFQVSGIPANARITYVGIWFQLDIAQPSCTPPGATWSNQVWMDGGGGIIGGTLDGTAQEYAGNKTNQIYSDYSWTGSPPSSQEMILGYEGSTAAGEITPGSSQQVDFAMPHQSYQAGDDCTRVFDFNGKVKSYLIIKYRLGSRLPLLGSG